MHDVLKAANAAEHAEVFHLKSRSLPLAFDAEGLSSVKLRQVEGLAVRVISNGKLGYATSTNLHEPKLVADAAIDAAQYGDNCSLRFAGGDAKPLEGVYSDAIECIRAEELAALGEAIHARILQAAPRVEASVNLETTVNEVRVANTEGADVQEKRSQVSVGIKVTRTQQDDIFVLSDGIQKRALSAVTAEAATAKVLKWLELAEDLVPPPSGQLPVVFTPAGAIALLLPLIIGLSGKSVHLGMSPLAGQLGETAFDPRLSLVDDGLAVEGAAAGGFDDEGVASQRTPLIESGVIRNFYYDLRTAIQAGAASTGNGFKGGILGGGDFRSAPGVSLSNLVIGSGSASPEELLREVKDGVLVDSVLGLGKGNLNAGDFSNNVSVAYRIQDGRITGRVKNLMISGNAYELLKDHLMGLGNDPDWIFGRLCAPSIAVSNVSVAAK